MQPSDEKAERLMGQRSPMAQPAQRRRITAALRFDSLRMPIAMGTRSQPTRERQLIFEAGLYDVDVRIEPDGVLWALSGALLGSDAGGQVELKGPATVQTELNSLGEFSLPPMPSGTYSLTLRLDDVDVSMELVIGE